MNLTANKLPSAIAAVIAAIKLKDKAPQRDTKLHQIIKYTRIKLKAANIKTLPSETAIIPIWVGEKWKALEMAKYCLRDNIYLQAVYFPMVPQNQAILRLPMNACHTKAQIDRMVEVVQAAQWEMS